MDCLNIAGVKSFMGLLGGREKRKPFPNLFQQVIVFKRRTSQNIYNRWHIFFSFFAFGMTSNAAFWNNSSNPLFKRALHSMYDFAPIFFATPAPCFVVTGRGSFKLSRPFWSKASLRSVLFPTKKNGAVENFRISGVHFSSTWTVRKTINDEFKVKLDQTSLLFLSILEILVDLSKE